ncbi:LysE/ArgO family amino acid transporter [Shewanella sp. AS16]|uniref:LysE/ArgO family amino acid transporter n=1 Tax=Shewanella sp. AS16 TaxID=2907625 RepID=UPI001F2D80F0|nr:LysE/ArgO family amino acid transporter [Shewanella sp. AS16]MCE9684647.1 LysE/ArgO family amino acid transporter [Shewanella sp. AS16]
MQTVFVQGVAIGASLIMAVGAQNAFVLKQGIKKAYPLPIALLCSMIDALMIIAGVAGLGRLIIAFPLLTHMASLGGAAFLIWYGANALRASFVVKGLDTGAGGEAGSLRGAILTTLGISLLNPHLYLDTLVLLGSISTGFDAPERPWFAAGAVLASFIWFFSLSFGARLLGPLFSKPVAWRYLDRFIWLTMWSIAGAILWPYMPDSVDMG